MLRLFRLLFLILTGLVLLVLALANRAPVPLRLLPDELAKVVQYDPVFQVPLFLVILAAVAAGVMIGFVWEWMREARIRSDAKGKSRQVARLERELAVLKDTTTVPARDEVLAMVEGGRSR
ncbi:LapA family protein [Rhodobacter sp. Har01]|uniref:LapA family protein n=1 Tax=Rhodobacter sp. Har01 TaxID=2883999 RepID=UPI001D06BDFE|nr:LapA family protein [Rhodobacter sp. Har01]MCB6178972.1 LapA family protein [Rhodobacter sp. Har01]